MAPRTKDTSTIQTQTRTRSRTAIARSVQGGEEVPDVADQLVRRLVCGEVPAVVVHGPAHDIRVIALGEAADAAEIATEPGERHRDRRRLVRALDHVRV